MIWRAAGYRGTPAHGGLCRGGGISRSQVAYCATCDREFFTGKDVFVVGGGFAAAEESVFLTKYTRHVTILLRKSDFACAAATRK